MSAGTYSDEGRVRRSWRLTRAAWELFKHDRTLIVLGALSTVVSAAATALIFYLGGYFDDPGGATGGDVALIGAIAAYPVTFITVSFNVALISAAVAALEGRHLTVGQAFAEAGKRIGKIAGWSLISVVVGTILNQIASRLPLGGRLMTWLVGAAWSLATLFVIPVLVLEDRGPVTSVRRSASIAKERWGETLSGTLTINAWLIFVSIPAVMVVGFGAAMFDTNPGVGAALVAIGLVGLVATVAAGSAVSGIFSLCLYRFAATGTADVFPVTDLERPFAPAKGGLFRTGGSRWAREDITKRQLDLPEDQFILDRADAEELAHGFGCSRCGRVFVHEAAALYHGRNDHRRPEGEPPQIVEF